MTDDKVMSALHDHFEEIRRQWAGRPEELIVAAFCENTYRTVLAFYENCDDLNPLVFAVMARWIVNVQETVTAFQAMGDLFGNSE
jgi:hypothetical protein